MINQKEAKIVKRIFEEYLAGNGTFKIANMLNEEKVKTVTGGKWHGSTILNILKNEKYKGDAKLQKTYIKDYLTKKKCKNNGEVDSFYIQENHSPIVTTEDWDKVQKEMEVRAKAKGNTELTKRKYQNRYPLTGMLYCHRCGAPLIRRTWNSKNKSRKIVWQCKTYIKEGKQACKGTKIDDDRVRQVDIFGATIIKEEMKNGKKYYRYTSKSQ